MCDFLKGKHLFLISPIGKLGHYALKSNKNLIFVENKTGSRSLQTAFFMVNAT